jgi:AcrR family transcriptional regulator
VVTRTGVTKRELSEEFTSEQELFYAAFDHGQALISQRLIAAVQDQRRWLARVRSALLSVLRFLDQEPQWAELLLIVTPPSGTGILARRERALGRLAELLERGAPKGSEVGLTLKSGLTAELVIGGAVSVLQARLLRHKGMPMLELAPSLMSLIVLPYLGAAQANDELTKRPAANPAPTQPSRELPRRASYRTALVLRAIAQAPRSNNRAIAQA